MKEILPDMMGEEASAFVKYETFEPKMLELLAGGEFEPDSDETLLQCFRASMKKVGATSKPPNYEKL